jgi:sigma-E factor negative regulatory protein RseA
MSGLGVIDDPLKEAVSALVDGEAGDFELRRVLDQASDPAVRALIGRHYAVRGLLRREAEVLCPPTLARSVMDVIDNEPLPRAGAIASRRGGWLGAAAVAASVCLVAVVGMRTLGGQQAPSQLAAAGSTLGTLGQPAVAPVAMGAGVRTVGLEAPIVDDADGIARDRLRMYMFDQAGNAALNTPEGMMPYARVVSWDEP